MVALTFFLRIPTTSSVNFFLKLGSRHGAGAERNSASDRGWAVGLERKEIQQVNEAGRWGWSGRERGAGVTGITKTLDPRLELMW